MLFDNFDIVNYFKDVTPYVYEIPHIRDRRKLNVTWKAIIGRGIEDYIQQKHNPNALGVRPAYRPTNDNPIVFCYWAEGYPMWEIISYIHETSIRNGIKPEKVIFLCSNLDIQKQYDEWYSYPLLSQTEIDFWNILDDVSGNVGSWYKPSTKMPWWKAEGKINVIGADFLQIYYQYKAQGQKPKKYNNKRSKVFLNLNGEVDDRPYRVRFLDKIEKSFDEGYISMISRGVSLDDDSNTDAIIMQDDINHLNKFYNDSYMNVVSENIHLGYQYYFEWKGHYRAICTNGMVDTTTYTAKESWGGSKFKHDLVRAQIPEYKKTGIVTIPKWIHREILEYKDFRPHNKFVTEKTYHPIYFGQPFMVIGSKGTLKYLKDIGYNTFPEIFDESYDDMFDLNDRVDSVVNELQRIIDLGEDRQDLFMSVKDKVIENQDKFLNDNVAERLLVTEIENVI
tara:strand:+ start:11 stop:1363 length:1353 start_codon:yes stop_codon:yes gene_type:complete